MRDIENMWKLSLTFHLLLILPISQSCQKKHLQNFWNDGKKGGPEPEVHHHNYHHHYDKDGHEIPPPHANADVLSGGHYYGDGVEQVSSVDGDYPAKHVVVLQPAPPPVDEDFFDSIIPKKFHPKHILKHHIHKLRDRFRELLGDKKEAIKTKHTYKHGGRHPQSHSRGPPPQPPSGPYPHGKVGIPALKIPLVQVEAYKPAPPNHYQDPHNPGGNAVAYVSPDGYKPAVVVKQQPQHPQYAEPHPHQPPPPPGEEYQYQPVAYEHPKPQQQLVSYQPQQQVAYHSHPQQPVAYHSHHPQSQSQPQVTVQVQPQITYASPEESPYHQPGSGSSPVYGPQSSQSPYHPFGSARTVTSYQHFGQGPTSSVSYSSGSPYSSDSSSPFSDSSIFQ